MRMSDRNKQQCRWFSQIIKTLNGIFTGEDLNEPERRIILFIINLRGFCQGWKSSCRYKNIFLPFSFNKIRFWGIFNIKYIEKKTANFESKTLSLIDVQIHFWQQKDLLNIDSPKITRWSTERAPWSISRL